MRIIAAADFYRNDIAGFDLKRRNINLSPVDFDMSVIDKLTSLPARSRKSRTIDDIIQTAFEHKQQDFARYAFLP
jgi:hypothetical protein